MSQARRCAVASISNTVERGLGGLLKFHVDVAMHMMEGLIGAERPQSYCKVHTHAMPALYGLGQLGAPGGLLVGTEGG